MKQQNKYFRCDGDEKLFQLISQFKGCCQIVVSKKTDSMYLLNWIFVKEKYRRTGLASTILGVICKYMDENQYYMVLDANDQFGTQESVLIKFYEKFGFYKRISDYHGTNMKRNPRK